MRKYSDEKMRKKYNRMLLKNGFKSGLKNTINENKELTFLEFLLKHRFAFLAVMIPLIIDFIKTGSFELDTCIVSLLALLLLSLCCWGASKIKSFHLGKKPYNEQYLIKDIPFDSDKQIAVIRCSICTGEQVAGFKSKEDGHFTEVMLIKDAKDLVEFKEKYKINEIKKEY